MGIVHVIAAALVLLGALAPLGWLRGWAVPAVVPVRVRPRRQV